MADKVVKVTLVAVAQPYVTGMKQASDTTSKLGRDIDQTGDKAGKFGSKVNTAKVALAGMAAAGAALVATKLAQFLGDAVAAAGDLEQSVGGVDAIFGDTADKIHEFGETSAEAVGLSRNEFNELITVTGALLKNKGLEDFSEKSLDLVGIGADLAATFGGSTKDAVDALNAAMRGESDPIERYGISLSKTAVNAELAAKGLDDLEGEALATAEAQARIEIIMRQSADATGAFAREVDTLQGQQQRLSAEWENAKASLGEALLPAMTDAVSMMREGVEVGLAIVAAFENIPTPVLTAAAALGAVHVLGGPLGRMAGTVSTTMRAAGEALDYAKISAEKAGGGFAGAKAGLHTFTGQASLTKGALDGLKTAGRNVMGLFGGPWGIAFMGAAALLGDFISEQREAKQRVEDLADALDITTGALDEFGQKIIDTELASSGAYDAAERLGIPLRLLADAAQGDADAIADLNERLDVLGERGLDALTDMQAMGVGVANTTEDVNLLREMTGQTNEELERARGINEQSAEAFGTLGTKALDAGIAIGTVGDESVEAAPVLDELGRTEEEVAEFTKGLREAHDDLIDSLVGMVDAAFGAVDAEIAYEQALDDLTAAVKENGDTHDISTEAGRKNKAALADVAQAARDNARAQFENGDALSTVTTDMMNARDAFIRGAEQMGYTREQAQRMADDFGLTADKVSTLRAEVGALPAGKNINITVTTRYVTIGDPANSGYSARTLQSVAADGAIISPRAGGGFGADIMGRVVPREPMLGGPRHGKRYIMWGEDETNEEAYVSRKPGMEARNKGILDVAAGWFGGKVSWFADGGLSSGRWSSSSNVTATLAPEDRALLRAVADRPVALSIGSRQSAQIVADGVAANRKYGG